MKKPVFLCLHCFHDTPHIVFRPYNNALYEQKGNNIFTYNKRIRDKASVIGPIICVSLIDILHYLNRICNVLHDSYFFTVTNYTISLFFGAFMDNLCLIFYE